MSPEIVSTVPALPRRPLDSHKGDFGRVLLIGGSRGMAGAPALGGMAALRAGSGLVRVATAAEVQPVVAGFEPSYMTYPLECDVQGRIRFEANQRVLEELVAGADVVAAGPGLGRSAELDALVAWLLSEVKVPLVLDADALNSLATQVDRLKQRQGVTVLTPHPGECARLTGKSTQAVQANRLETAIELARLAPSGVIVLKGEQSLVSDGKRVYVNTTGNPGMATGGSGDVLTGIVASLLGQHFEPFEATLLAVHVHGLAGDIACEEFGEAGMIARDLLGSLPNALVAVSTDEPNE